MNQQPPAFTAESAELFHSLPVALAALDARGTVLEANAALCAILGYTRAEITELTWADLHAPQDPDGSFADCGGRAGHLHRLIGKHGEQVVCDISSAASPQQNGERVWLTTFVDVGERQQRTGQFEPAAPHASLEQQLREAIAHDQLTVHYQPVVDRAGYISSAEALVRWPHPQHGLLFPSSIMPAARHAGLLPELDEWVLRAALQQATAWPACGDRPVGIAINLGSQLLHDPAFDELLAEIVAACGLPWDRLILEITETDLLDLAPATHGAITGLVERGVRFAVDDFGTGYSSLERLKDLPVQAIKLDRKFVSGVEDDPVDTAIAGAALSIARARGSVCVAEGVETAGQLHRLAGFGYDKFQGFLFSPAVPAPEFRALIGRPLPSGTGERSVAAGLVNTGSRAARDSPRPTGHAG
ncbi:EAL domain-containing protein [Saccharopolyspora sp. SCSIO 74807]|uniref:EAL domain-containing protein n=1 Tax=Saccharopolyspora sp. SCSIO 74807 TaxID=3118084 RepID=UPI0030CC8235